MDFLDSLPARDALRELGWGAEVFAVVALTLIGRFVIMALFRLITRHLNKTSNVWDDSLFAAAKPSLSWFILIMGLLWAVDISNSYVSIELFSAHNLNIVRQLTVIVLVMLFVTRFIKQAEDNTLNKLRQSEYSQQTRVDPSTIMALGRLLRLAVVISALLMALPTLGIEITALLAFGGVGGIAVGFAAQDLLANFFGGLMIYLDRPFSIGDWIRSPDREIEGTVESIGWRLTVVRTFDKRPLYVPNSVFNKLALENPSRMSNRRIKETIGLRYEDADKMSDIVDAVKAMLKGHPEIDSKQTLMVNFNSYGVSSLEFFIYTFTRTTNWVHFHEIKQDVLLQIITIVHDHGADFAFPTTTLDGLQPLLGQQRGEPAAIDQKPE